MIAITSLNTFIVQHTGPVGSTTYEINFTADVYERQLEAESKSAWLDNQLKKVSPFEQKNERFDVKKASKKNYFSV